LENLRKQLGSPITPPDLLQIAPYDPGNLDDYQNIVDGIKHHKEDRGRFVYVQTPGIFEALNGVFGIENHLCHLIEYEKEIREVYRRQAEWNKAFANNCIDLGVDMIHVSDDWGAQHGLMFSPKMWRDLIYPFHKTTCDAVKARKTHLSLHTDGNNNAVLDGIVELGYEVLHPFQESAGMSLDDYKDNYMARIVVMGGLDVQTTIGFGDLERLKTEIERLVRMFADGGLLFCTTHFVQAHCSIEELTFAFDTVYSLIRE